MKKTSRTRIANAGKRAEVPASEVRNAWHEFVDRVSQAREEIVVTRSGKPVMKLTPSRSRGIDLESSGFWPIP